MYRQPLHGNTTIAAVLPTVAIPGGALPLQPRSVMIHNSNSDSSFDTVTERSNYNMPNRQRSLGINIRVTPEEKKKIERNARKCRLSVSEYLRQIAMKVEPKELPSEDILLSIMRLQAEISLFERYSRSAANENGSKFYGDIAERLRIILTETLQLMTHTAPESKVKADGND